MDERLSAQWFDPLFRADDMRRVFSDLGRLQGILDFESALARAQARAGIVPASAAEAMLADASQAVGRSVRENGKISNKLLDREQRAAHGLAWFATYAEAARAMNDACGAVLFTGLELTFNDREAT